MITAEQIEARMQKIVSNGVESGRSEGNLDLELALELLVRLRANAMWRDWWKIGSEMMAARMEPAWSENDPCRDACRHTLLEAFVAGVVFAVRCLETGPLSDPIVPILVDPSHVN